MSVSIIRFITETNHCRFRF